MMKAVDFKKIQLADLPSIGYSAASQSDVMSVLAKELLRRFPSGELSDATIGELQTGMVGRKAELMGTMYFVHKGSEYTPIENESKAGENDSVVAFNVDYAHGMSAYDFGQLKTKDPAKYEIVAAIRTSVNKYKSNATGDLLRAVKNLKNDVKGRTRAANKAYFDWIADKKKGLVQTMLTRAATARKNGDPTAPKDKAELKKMLCEQIDKA